MEIELGTNKLPRFQCACHKLNTAIRTAIDRHTDGISEVLRKLARSNATIRRVIKLSHTFRMKKSKLNGYLTVQGGHRLF